MFDGQQNKSAIIVECSCPNIIKENVKITDLKKKTQVEFLEIWKTITECEEYTD